MNKLWRQLNRFLSRLIQRLFPTQNRGSFSGSFRGSFSVANCGLSLIDQGTLAGAVEIATMEIVPLLGIQCCKKNSSYAP